MNTIKESLAAILIAVALLGFTGCTTTPEGERVIDMVRASHIAYDVGDLGGTAALIQNPETRRQLEITRDALTVLGNQEQVDFDALLTVLRTLPIDQMQTPEAQLILAGGRILLREVQYAVDLQPKQDLRPVVLALRDGLNAALGGGIHFDGVSK